MIKFFTTALLVLGLLSSLAAQDAVYLRNGSRMAGSQLLELTDDKIRFTMKRGDAMVPYNYQRENVLLAFNAEGNYLVISDLSTDLAEAQQQLKTFLMSTARVAKTDLLIKATPVSVIAGRISYESDDAVNYELAKGDKGSIGKAELVAILYADGRHQLLRDPDESVSLLATAKPMLTGGGTGAVPAPQTAQAPKSAPMPAPVPSRALAPAAPMPTAAAAMPPPAAAMPTPATAAPTVPEATPVSAATTRYSNKPVLSETEYAEYRTKAMRRVDEFAQYLNVITDKSLPPGQKDQAIDQAAKLFLPSATIEVTSKNKTGSRRYPVREYLSRLKMLPYSSTKVEWSEIQYIKELTQAADGNYYGTITGQQTFMGYGASGQDVMYSDVTQKNVKVKLESYQKIVDGQAALNWQVLLGNIGVGSN